MTESLNQNVVIERKPALSDGVRIISAEGVFSVSIRMDMFLNFSSALIPFVIWLDSLDESHKVILSVVTPRICPAYGPQEYLTLINALDRCKAHVSIKMDHYEPTQAAYIYLVADTVIVYPSGGIFFGPVSGVTQNDNQEVKPVFVSYITALAQRAKDRGFLSDRELDAISKSTPIGLRYKDIISRDLSTVGEGVDLRE